jgi:lipopolysaccharide cholinephosphotransferase
MAEKIKKKRYVKDKRALDNMDHSLEEIHALLLEKAKEFHRVCTENGIEYSVLGGSALGAVRHHGFIPWDDDYDVIMTRDNYNKLLENRDKFKGFYLERYTYIYHLLKENMVRDFAGFDIFVFDKVPSDKNKEKKKMFRIKTLQGMFHHKLHLKRYKSFGDKVKVFGTFCLGKILPTGFKMKRYDKVSVIGNDDPDARYVSFTNGLYRDLGRRYDVHILDEVMNVPFEDTEVSIMKRYDEYLTEYYGDYMTPPSEEEIAQRTFKVAVNNKVTTIKGTTHNW